MRIPRSLREAMIKHAVEGLPFEVCGILGGTGIEVSRIHPARNLKESSKHFLMDPREQIAAMESLHSQGLEVLAFYHSHPAGPAYPSTEDVRLAFYPDVITVIVSLENPDVPVVNAFKIFHNHMYEETVEVLDDTIQ